MGGNAGPRDVDAGLRLRLLAVGVAIVCVIALRMTREVSMPIVAGLLLAALVWPLLIALERGLPRALALLTTVLLVVAVLASLFAAVGWSVRSMGERMMERRARIEEVHQRLETAALRVGMHVPPLPGTARQAPVGSTEAADGARTVMRIGRAALSSFGLLALTIGFMALALAEARTVRDRVRARFPAAQAERIVGTAGEVARRMQRYLVVKSITSAITGSATLVIAFAYGLDFAPVWALLTFLFEYVPTIGSILAVIPPTLYAAVQFDGLGRSIAFAGTLTVMQLFLGNYVDPKIEGRLLSLSPFVVLASIVLWAWIWGAPGALLGVPITVALTTASRHFESSRWIWALLSEEDAADSEAEGASSH